MSKLYRLSTKKEKSKLSADNQIIGKTKVMTNQRISLGDDFLLIETWGSNRGVFLTKTLMRTTDKHINL